MDQAKQLKDLDWENGRLNQVVAELTLDKLILKEAAEGNWPVPAAANARGIAEPP